MIPGAPIYLPCLPQLHSFSHNRNNNLKQQHDTKITRSMSG
jgi:hypothetical protein